MSLLSLASLSLLLSCSYASSNNLPAHGFASDHVKTIKIGMSNALTGPTASLGIELRKGANSYFNHLNKQGGINGKLVELISLDDGYEPENTVVNTKELISQQVLALFSYVGTPTSHAIMPLLQKSQTPYLMPFTGADFLRNPDHKNIFNLRASYYQEVKAQVDYLISVKRDKNIALVIQADEFGLTAQRAINKIFSDKKLNIALTTRYKRNTNNIEEVLTKLSSQPIDAVIFVGTYQPFIHLINLAHQQELDILFTSLSFVGSHNILNKIPPTSKVLLSEVVPEPKNCTWQLCEKFITDMAREGYTKLNRVQLEGYLNAFVFTQVAKRCLNNLSQKCLLQQFQQYHYLDNGLSISFSRDNLQEIQPVYFTLSSALKKQPLTPAFTH